MQSRMGFIDLYRKEIIPDSGIINKSNRFGWVPVNLVE